MSDDDQIVPIADSALLSSKRLKHGTLRVYRGLGHGLCTINHDVINTDLLAFIQSETGGKRHAAKRESPETQ